MLILGKDPLKAAENYRTIETIIQGGKVVDAAKLPERSILTRALDCAEESGYVAFLGRRETFPVCGCMRR